jgi:hypothetical protein
MAASSESHSALAALLRGKEEKQAGPAHYAILCIYSLIKSATLIVPRLRIWARNPPR